MPRPTTEFDPKGVSAPNTMYDLEGALKKFCVGCGGPRSVEYAKSHACICCGSYGTQDSQPEFDQYDELVPAEVVAARKEAEKQARIERLKAAKAAAIPVAQSAPKPTLPVAKSPREVARTSASTPNVQALPKPKTATAKERKQAAASTLAALF